MGEGVMAGIGNFIDNLQGDLQARQEREETPDYKPEWTHPEKLELGFSHSFEDETTTVILDNGGTRDEKRNRGICPNCRRNLVINGTDEDGNRIYGLRCGHMIDARCFQLLTRPDNGLPIIDKKGKGKAREDYYASDEGDVPQGSAGGPYRLRSRTAAAAVQQSPRKKATRGRRGKKKGPVITAQHWWKCPVDACQRAHVSVQFDDSQEWIQDKERGAIAIFV